MILVTSSRLRTQIIFGLATVALGTALGAVSSYRPPDEAPPVHHAVSVHVSSAFDVADTRKLVGFSTHVFVGRVVRTLGTDSLPDTAPGGPETPVTLFAVEVRENIKGRAVGTVTLNQMGGRDSEGTLMLFEGDPLLLPGQEYIFVTRRLRVDGSYQLVAPGYDSIQLENAQRRSTALDRFRVAHREEIPFDPTRR